MLTIKNLCQKVEKLFLATSEQFLPLKIEVSDVIEAANSYLNEVAEKVKGSNHGPK